MNPIQPTRFSTFYFLKYLQHFPFSHSRPFSTLGNLFPQLRQPNTIHVYHYRTKQFSQDTKRTHSFFYNLKLRFPFDLLNNSIPLFYDLNHTTAGSLHINAKKIEKKDKAGEGPRHRG